MVRPWHEQGGVVKTVFGRGTDVEFGVGIELLDRRRHHVRRAVTDGFEGNKSGLSGK